MRYARTGQHGLLSRYRRSLPIEEAREEPLRSPDERLQVRHDTINATRPLTGLCRHAKTAHHRHGPSGVLPSQMKTITDWLEHWSVEQPEKRLYTFLDITGQERESYTYRPSSSEARTSPFYLSEKAGPQEWDRSSSCTRRPGDHRGLLRLRPHRRDRRSRLRAVAHNPRGRTREAQAESLATAGQRRR